DSRPTQASILYTSLHITSQGSLYVQCRYHVRCASVRVMARCWPWLSDVFSHRLYSIGSPQCSCSPFSKFALHTVRMAERAKTLHGTNVVASHLQHFHHFPGCSFGSWLSRFQSLGGVGSNPTAAIITSWLCSPL